MTVYGRIVGALAAVGVLFIVLAALRGRFDGVALLAVVTILLALFTTYAAWTNRKRHRS
ncbi:hypothetical protein B0I12_002525 [Microbacterium hydrothermale]|nr:hypothetical protein [Microbacterium hydrothermale]